MNAISSKREIKEGGDSFNASQLNWKRLIYNQLTLLEKHGWLTWKSI
jgi:hypothetical protein